MTTIELKGVGQAIIKNASARTQDMRGSAA
jgi:hypothetical protein